MWTEAMAFSLIPEERTQTAGEEGLWLAACSHGLGIIT